MPRAMRAFNEELRGYNIFYSREIETLYNDAGRPTFVAEVHAPLNDPGLRQEIIGKLQTRGDQPSWYFMEYTAHTPGAGTFVMLFGTKEDIQMRLRAAVIMRRDDT